MNFMVTWILCGAVIVSASRLYQQKGLGRGLTTE
jgi:hypothetical protein